MHTCEHTARKSKGAAHLGEASKGLGKELDVLLWDDRRQHDASLCTLANRFTGSISIRQAEEIVQTEKAEFGHFPSSWRAS